MFYFGLSLFIYLILMIVILFFFIWSEYTELNTQTRDIDELKSLAQTKEHITIMK